jgi:hypothetical protein
LSGNFSAGAETDKQKKRDLLSDSTPSDTEFRRFCEPPFLAAPRPAAADEGSVVTECGLCTDSELLGEWLIRPSNSSM